MSIISSPFFIFLLFSLTLYYFLPEKFQHSVLLLSGIFFYILISPLFTLFLVILTLCDYYIALKMPEVKFTNGKKKLLIFGITVNLLYLVFFKFHLQIEKILAPVFPSFNLWKMEFFTEIAIPLGVSYYIFKKISYLIDVYRGVIDPEENYFSLLLYVSFFPEIAAGPIDRAKDLIPQLKKNSPFNPDFILSGFQRILWGIFKKVVIADRIAVFTDMVFRNFRSYNRETIILALIMYSVQIYCDFSAIADIAIGIGKMFGKTIPENFKRPWFSISISDFWRRWHITLSEWLRDYLFLPLAYMSSRNRFLKRINNRRSDNIIYFFSALITMTLCGVWHGAKWTFVLWGAFHGLMLALSRFFSGPGKLIRKKMGLKRNSGILKAYHIIKTYFLVTFSWIFFRSESIHHSFGMIKQLISPGKNAAGAGELYSRILNDFPSYTAEILIISFFILLVVEIISSWKDIGKTIMRFPIPFRLIFYYVAIFFILIFTVKVSGDFIYINF